jgi:hypothetical protein
MYTLLTPGVVSGPKVAESPTAAGRKFKVAVTVGWLIF